MNLRIPAALCQLTLLTLLTPHQTLCAAAAPEAAEQRLKHSVDQVVLIAKQSRDRAGLMAAVEPVLQKILNFGTMTRRAVGPGWREFTPDQQKEAVRLFTILILRTYTAKFTPGEYPSVQYKPSCSPSLGRVEIPTTALYKGSRYDVVYRMDEAGGWQITDVVIEGVSLVANYRTQFDAEFKQGGAEAVLKALRRSVADAK
jgi:phospholipid transport system substrate-binding protein